MVAGSWRLVVVSFIQASMDAASSRESIIVFSAGGGSVVLQDRTSIIKLKTRTTIFPDITSPLNNCLIKSTSKILIK